MENHGQKRWKVFTRHYSAHLSRTQHRLSQFKRRRFEICVVGGHHSDHRPAEAGWWSGMTAPTPLSAASLAREIGGNSRKTVQKRFRNIIRIVRPSGSISSRIQPPGTLPSASLTWRYPLKMFWISNDSLRSISIPFERVLANIDRLKVSGG